MARKPRLDTRYGLYHVMSKGNDGRLLFRQPEDFSKFQCLLADSFQKDPHILLSYCLMPNHIHLLMETLEVPLSKIMHRLLLRYSMYFNKRYSRTGHLFQNRFKAKPCKHENYLLQLLVYIHDNPRKAGLLEGDGTYPYSSEKIYQKKVAVQQPVNNARALELIGPTARAAWIKYQQYLSHTRSQNKENFDPDTNSAEGKDTFHPDKEIYLETYPLPAPAAFDSKFDFLINVPLDQMCAMVADVLGVDPEAIQGNGKSSGISRARGLLIYLSRMAGWRPVDLKNTLGFNPGTVSHHMARYDEGKEQGEVFRMLEELRRLIDAGKGRKGVQGSGEKFDF